ENGFSTEAVGEGPREQVRGGLRNPEREEVRQDRARGGEAEDLRGEERKNRPFLADHATDEPIHADEHRELREVRSQAQPNDWHGREYGPPGPGGTGCPPVDSGRGAGRL